MNGKLGTFFGYVSIGVIALGVLLFLGSHSLNFFQFTFTEDDAIYSWLGLLLTSGGVIGWLVVFETLAKTTMQKGIALIMMVVGLLGEMATAVFDMRYSAVYGTFAFTDTELGQMTLLIGLLGAVTGLCLIAFFAGDHIVRAFQDDDKDGIPNWSDKEDNRKSNKGSNRPQNAPVATQRDSGRSSGENKTQTQEGTNFEIDALLQNSGKSRQDLRDMGYVPFGKFTAGQFDYIDAQNIEKLWVEVKHSTQNPTQPVASNNGKR